jgi:hypothetical protein
MTRAFTGNLAPQLFTALAANSGYPAPKSTQVPCLARGVSVGRKRAGLCNGTGVELPVLYTYLQT